MIQDLSGSWCIKGTGESTLVMDSPVPLMHHDPDRSWITDPDPDHSKRTQPSGAFLGLIWINLFSKETQNLFSKETQNPFLDSFGFKNPILDFFKETHP